MGSPHESAVINPAARCVQMPTPSHPPGPLVAVAGGLETSRRSRQQARRVAEECSTARAARRRREGQTGTAHMSAHRFPPDSARWQWPGKWLPPALRQAGAAGEGTLRGLPRQPRRRTPRPSRTRCGRSSRTPLDVAIPRPTMQRERPRTVLTRTSVISQELDWDTCPKSWITMRGARRSACR